VPMFRYSAVQKGRYREHYQFGVEAIGSDDPAVDAEQIGLQRRWYERVGVRGLQLLVNSIGDGKCRPAYLQLLVGYLDQHADELCDECRERRDVNPLRTFDCKEKGCRAVMAGAPKITDNLCEECAAHFADVRAHLDARGVAYAVDPGLVRGLDYYTRTAWEWQWTELGAQSALSGGGRYDGLAEALGGQHTPGVGFGAGIERLLLALEGTPEPEEEGIDVFYVCAEGADRAAVLAKVAELRAAGVRADLDFAGRSVKGQHTQAGRLGAKKVVVVQRDTDLAEAIA